MIPLRLDQVAGKPLDVERLRASYLKRAAEILPVSQWSETDVQFLAADTNSTPDQVRSMAPTA